MKARVWAVGTCLCLLACGSDDGATSDPPAKNLIDTALRVLPADEAYAGQSLEHWAVEYMRWYYSWTSEMCLTAENDRDGSRCGFNQPADSPVFFFASCDYARTGDTVVRRSQCKVPAGKAILVPISVIGDDEAGIDESEARTPEEVADNVATIHETMRNLSLVADQKTVDDLSGYSVGPTAFDFSTGEAPNWHSCNGFDGVVNETIDPSYVAGYFALVAPPTPGTHQLEYSGVYTYIERDYFRRVDSVFEVTER